MDFNAIINWVKRNLKIVIPSILLLLFIGFLFFGGSTPDSKIPGGGFGTLVLAGLVFFGAHKAGEGKMRVILGSIATALLVVAVWPRVFPLINFLGLAPNIIMILAILVGVWMWKGGKGFFAWRMFLFIFLVLCWIGANGKVFKEGFEGFKSSTGIEFKVPEIKTPDFFKGVTSYIGHISASQTSKFKERLLKKDAYMYKYDGSNFSKSAIAEAKDLKVFLLGETVQKDGLSFERVRFNDPATGEEFWIYAGDLLTGSQATESVLAPPVIIPPSQTPPVVNNRNWQEVARSPLNFSTMKVEQRGAGYQAVFPVNLALEPGTYKVTIKGNYELFMGESKWVPFSWKGNNRGAAKPDFKPFPQFEYGAIVLENNNQAILPENDGGIEVHLGGNFQVIPNFLVGSPGNFNPKKISGSIFKNDPQNPISIIIEKEVK